MKTQRRHELQTNALADRLGGVMLWVEQRYKVVVAAAVLVAASIAVYVAMSRSSAAKIDQGWTEYFSAMSAQNPDAMSKVAETYPATDAGNWARLWLGDQELQVGVEQMFQDRPQANDELRKAVFNYELVLQQTVDPLLAQRTKFGLARAYESLDQLDEARKIYEELADTAKWKPEPLFAKQAEARLANLNLPQTKAFYDWFAQQDPKPSLQGGGGASPFSIPGLDSQLPDEPGSLVPSAFDSLRGEGSLDESPVTPDATEPAEGATPSAEEPPAEVPPAEEPPVDEPATPEAAAETSTDEASPSTTNEPAPNTP